MLWLWHRLAVIVLIAPLAWEPPYAMSAGLKDKKNNNNNNNLDAELSTSLDSAHRIHVHKAGWSNVDFTEDFCGELEETVYIAQTMACILDSSVPYFIRYCYPF